MRRALSFFKTKPVKATATARPANTAAPIAAKTAADAAARKIAADAERPATEALGYITIATKATDQYKLHTASIARSDAHHDLSTVFNTDAYNNTPEIKTAFNSGLPLADRMVPDDLHEVGSLSSVILSVGGNTYSTLNPKDRLDAILDSVLDCTKEIKLPSVFEIGIPSNAGGKAIPLFQYEVVKFVIESSTNRANTEEPCKGNFGATFVANTGLSPVNKAGLIVDFSQHKFLEKLTEGIYSDFKMEYLMTPEVVNDPAGKPNIHNKTLFGLPDSGVRLSSHIQTDIDVTSYTKFNPNDPSPANNFFSNYDITLSPIRQIITQKANRLATDLTIKFQPDRDGKPLIDTIEDSKGENSITTVVGYLRNIMSKLPGATPANKNMLNFNFSSKCQQKRGGDWFQALACLGLTGRSFTQILPSVTEPWAFNGEFPIYFVTHDRIAVAYALENGVNVIYIDYYGRIFIFKNTRDKTLIVEGGVSREQLLFNNIGSTYNGKDKIDKLLKYSISFETERVKFMTEISGDIDVSIKTFKYNVDVKYDADFKTELAGQFVIDVTNLLPVVFFSAIRVAFAEINIPDIRQSIADVTNYKDLLTRDYSSKNDSSIGKLNKAINNLHCTQSTFGGAVNQSITLNVVLKAWLDRQIIKTDVYKAAKDVFLINGDVATGVVTGAEGSVISRLVTFWKTPSREANTERKTDSFTFLPFINSMENAVVKTKLHDVLTGLLPKVINFDAFIKKNAPRRRGAVDRKTVFAGKLTNLIYETFIIVTIPQNVAIPIVVTDRQIEVAKTAITNSDLGGLTSTDNLLLDADISDFTVLKSVNGKYSIDTETQEDESGIVPSFGGANLYDYMAASTPGAVKENTILDVSVKQTVWPLITNVLMNSTSSDNVDTFCKQINDYLPDVGEYSIKDIAPRSNWFVSMLTSMWRYPPTINIESYPANDMFYDAEIAAKVDKPTAADYATRYYPSMGGSNSAFTRLASNLYEKYRNNEVSSSTANLLLDFNLGFHPLLPIYTMLTSYYSVLGIKDQGNPFFYTYFTYINILEKMKTILETNYLNNMNNPYKTASAYFVGFGLNAMLILSNTSLIETNEILRIINMKQSDYYTFSLKNDCFASLITGAVQQTPADEALGAVFINNALFSNFIAREVNIKQILEQGTPASNLPRYEVLKDRIFKLMQEIVIKVNADRGTPIVPRDTAAGVTGIPSPADRALQAERGQRRYLAKQSISPIQKSEPTLKPFDKSRIIDTSKMFNYSNGSSENTVRSSSTSSNRSRSGGKKTRKHNSYNRKRTKKRRQFRNKRASATKKKN